MSTDYSVDRLASLAGRHVAATRALLFRLAAGEDIVTSRYSGEPKGLSFNVAHRRGYVVSRRFGPPKPKGRRLTGNEISYWRHNLTPHGRAALAAVGRISASSARNPPIGTRTAE